ncbi:plexin-B2-like [Clavelina lepadiformis]|uniref:plexin-B2-like n=1 Tax=Clavelina lepadiformis TaxID=159417 RepID=UPI00404302BC
MGMTFNRPVCLLLLFSLIILASIVRSEDERSDMYVVSRFSPENSTINHLAVNENLGYVYVAAKNRLFQLTKNLSEVIVLGTGPVKDNVKCLPFSTNPCKEEKRLTDNFNKLLLVDSTGNRLIVCGSVYQGTCKTHDLRDISNILYNVSTDNQARNNMVACNQEYGSTVGVITEGPTVNNPVLYVAATVTKHLYRHDFSIATRSLYLDHEKENCLLRLAIEQKSAEGSTLRDENVQRDYKYIFETGGEDGFVYFVFNQEVPKNSFHSVIARICKSDVFYNSYIELPVKCVDDAESEILGAYYAEDVNNGTLYVLFSTDTGSALCYFTTSQLDSLYYETLEICYRHLGQNGTDVIVGNFETHKKECQSDTNKPFITGSQSLSDVVVKTDAVTLDYYPDYKVPKKQILCGAPYLPSKLTLLQHTYSSMIFSMPNERFSAIITDRVNENIVAFIGTNNTESAFSNTDSIIQVNVNTGRMYNKIETKSPVLPDFVWNNDENQVIPHLYVTTKSEVLNIRVAACEQFKTCNECISSDDPYCGWCILESRCSTKKDCTTAKNAWDQRWLGPNSGKCIAANSSLPIERTLNQDVVIDVTLLPPLSRSENEKNKIYSCEFDGFSAKLAKIGEMDQSSGVTKVTCSTPSHDELPPTPGGQDFLSVVLMLKFDGVGIASTDVVFYECGVYGRFLNINQPCSGCLSSGRACTWCIHDHQCKPNSTVTCEHNVQNCPTLFGTTDRLLPVNQMHSITFSAKNLPIGHYNCNVSFESYRHEEVPAERSPSGDQVTCKAHMYNYDEDRAEAKADVTVTWNLDYLVDSTEAATAVTFYKCSSGRTDCSTCVTSDLKYNCGWCQTSKRCTINTSCANFDEDWVTDGDLCPPLQITDFYPPSGPLDGGTLVHIYGTDMGTRVEDVDRVTVAGEECRIIKSLYQVSKRVVCSTGLVVQAKSEEIQVTVKNRTRSSMNKFHYRNPKVNQVSRHMGPIAGGTALTIYGNNLDTGYNITVTIGDTVDLPCISQKRPNNTNLECTTTPASTVMVDQDIKVQFDDNTAILSNAFEYTENPDMKEIYTASSSKQIASFLSGGRNITFIGVRFLSVKEAYLSTTLVRKTEGALQKKRSIQHMVWQLRKSLNRHKRTSNTLVKDIKLPAYVFNKAFISKCHVKNDTFMTCFSPEVVDPSINLTNQIDQAFPNISTSVNWDAEMILHMDGLAVKLGSNLILYPDPQIQALEDDRSIESVNFLTIKVSNLNLDAITGDEIKVMIGPNLCPFYSFVSVGLLCQVPERTGEDLKYSVNIRIGNIYKDIGTVTYNVDEPSLPNSALIAIIVGVSFVALLIIGLVVYFVRKSKVYKANKNDFQKAIENMEMSVRADFRKAFAELNVDMSDLTADMDYAIPCFDYRTYVTNLFFPSYRYHPCMKPPDPNDKLNPNLEQGLSQFLLLLSNHNFLSVFIHTLEEQKSFSNRDKSNVASLLTVALHNKLDYFTEIMKSLVSDLIDQNVQRNPKLILRRSDSVAERMLSNWMYICLYPYVREKAGSPIFLLLKAIKQQVSKGPLDAVTGKARYTLSDDRLLQEDVENEVLTLFVALTNSTDDEPVIVKVLSCDSVAQVKEKVMDAVYKRVPFSQRPKPEHLDIEWRHGRSGHLILPNNDYTAEPGSRWRRLMTISDYKVANNATLALIPKQNEYGGSQDLSISNHSTDVSALSPMLPEDSSSKMYHLVKYNDDLEAKRESTIKSDRHKHIPDLYLLRLINMKGILQNYVDAVLNAILDKSSIPCPVKHFFHFLDENAARKGITDPEVLHIWKTNSLLGRFWVTILKNPESVFDIEKPDTIASTMAVISQTFIDACSVMEIKPTKDSPINKQLYAKEIPTYKKLVQDYYEVIKDQHPVSDQDVNAYIAGIYREHGCEFDVNVALNELWGYLSKYYEEVNESLEIHETMSPAVRQRLNHTYSLIDNLVNGTT